MSETKKNKFQGQADLDNPRNLFVSDFFNDR